MGVRASYMVMLVSPLYRAEEPGSRAKLARLVELGHEVGLHFDIHDRDHAGHAPDLAAIERRLRAAAHRLEQLTSRPVQSVSFHRPVRPLQRGPLYVAGLVNAYAAPLMAWYLSDSKGSWREGDPLASLRNPAGPVLQVLIHPVWWDEEHRGADDVLDGLFAQATCGMSPGEIEALDAAMAGHLSIWRRRTRGQPASQLASPPRSCP
jgi:hypothetical protein